MVSAQLHSKPDLNAAVQLHQRGELDSASAIYRSILDAEPNHADALHLLGVVAKQKRQLPEAIELIELAIEQNPQGASTPDYHNNCAEAYRASFCYPEAFQHYQKSLALRGNPTVSLLFNLGGCFQELGQHDEALLYFDQAIAISPDYARAHFRRAYSHLGRGDFDSGWRDYEWHVQAQSGERYIRPPWGGSILPRPSDTAKIEWANSQTLVVCDQGLGDEICLLRFLPQLEQLGTHVTYYAPDKLSGLLARNQVCDLWNGKDRNFKHIYCLSDLPRLVGMTTLEALPPPLTLRTSPELKSQYTKRLSDLPRPWMGVTWRAGLTAETQSQIKAIPQSLLLEHFSDFTGTLVILQRGITANESAALAGIDTPVIDLSSEADQLEPALALMDVLDGYTAVANTNVHLRTSLGKQSSVLTSANAIDYRWPSNSTSSSWFPGSQAFRQSSDGTWDSALADLKHTTRV